MTTMREYLANRIAQGDTRERLTAYRKANGFTGEDLDLDVQEALRTGRARKAAAPAKNAAQGVVDSLTAPLVDDLIQDLKDKINTGTYTSSDLKTIINLHVGVSSDLTVALNQLGDPVATVDGFLFDLKTRLEKIEQSWRRNGADH